MCFLQLPLSRANLKIFDVKMCRENSATGSFFMQNLVLNLVRQLLQETSSKISRTSGEVWNSIPKLGPRCFVIPCRVNKSLNNYAIIILNLQGFNNPATPWSPLEWQFISVLQWDESQRTRGRRTCWLNPEHLFGFCFESCWGFWKKFTLLNGTDTDWRRVLWNDRWWNASEAWRWIFGQGAEITDCQDTFNHPPTDSLVYG